MGLVGELLERSARATPAVVEDRASGWWLRRADNAVWWSGAVIAHPAADQLGERIAAAERFYAERRAVARFHVCPDCPAGLDRSLAERGYRWEAPVSVLAATTGGRAGAPAPPGTTVRLGAPLTPDWLGVLGATSPPGTDVEHETRLLRGVERPQTYVTVLADGEPVGIGRAVAETGWTGVFSMATVPQARRRGVAQLVLGAIARWGEEHDAPRLYLQVERSNGPARRLYETVGFSELATYHYRAREAATGR